MEWPVSTGESAECQLCRRWVPRRLITLHHLTPKQKGGKAEDRVPLCKPCHKQLHAMFTNKELMKEYSTVEKLRGAPLLDGFLKWIVKQKVDRSFSVAVAKGRRGR